MAWPNDPVPPNRPNLPPHETAAQHLDYIQNRAQTLLNPASPMRQRILDAVAACRKSQCLLSGVAPQDGVHGQFVLWARWHAYFENWAFCADELEHGA